MPKAETIVPHQTLRPPYATTERYPHDVGGLADEGPVEPINGERSSRRYPGDTTCQCKSGASTPALLMPTASAMGAVLNQPPALSCRSRSDTSAGTTPTAINKRGITIRTSRYCFQPYRHLNSTPSSIRADRHQLSPGGRRWSDRPVWHNQLRPQVARRGRAVGDRERRSI